MSYYLAYGANLNAVSCAMNEMSSKVIGRVYLEDYRLVFHANEKGAFLSLEPEKGAEAPAVIYEISDEDEKWLDRFMGCPEFQEKKWFENLLFRSHNHGWDDVTCYAYTCVASRPLVVPSIRYLSNCLHGYWLFHFDEQYLYDALYESYGELFEGGSPFREDNI